MPGLPRLAMLLLALACGGCGRTAIDTTDVRCDLKLTPSPPSVGDADAVLELANPDGSPLTGATVRLEGNMNHAGMKPSFADLRETEPGHYAGTLKFTMGGDWFVLVTAQTADGKSVQHKLDIPGVQAK